MSDAAIWATWYDLDEADRPRYLGWLHEKYLPALEASSAYAWVAQYELKGFKEAPPQSTRPDGSLAIGRSDAEDTGHQFITLIAAASPRTFLDPIFLKGELQVTPDAAELLALRKRPRRSLFLEQQRVTGKAPGAASHPAYPGPAIQFGTFRMNSIDADFDAMAFYEQNRLPIMARSVQCIRTRKMISVAGWPKHGIIYEFTSLAARNELWEQRRVAKAAGDPEEKWTINERTLHSPGSPVVGVRTWPVAK